LRNLRNDQRGKSLRRLRQTLRHDFRCEDHVAVEDQQPRACRELSATVALPAALGSELLEPGGEPPRDLRRLVVREVVDDQDLQILHRLVLEALETGFERAGRILRGHDDRDASVHGVRVEAGGLISPGQLDRIGAKPP